MLNPESGPVVDGDGGACSKPDMCTVTSCLQGPWGASSAAKLGWGSQISLDGISVWSGGPMGSQLKGLLVQDLALLVRGCMECYWLFFFPPNLWDSPMQGGVGSDEGVSTGEAASPVVTVWAEPTYRFPAPSLCPCHKQGYPKKVLVG